MQPDVSGISAYFARIGYSGPRAPSLGLLRELHARHPARIAFECLDPFLGRLVSLDPEAITDKLVGSRRGGYCHEHNGLFYDVLAQLGFRVTAHGGRVLWMDPARDAPLTHRLTLVDLPEGRFVADVGFGGQSATAPLLLEPGLVQPTSHGTYRVMCTGENFEVQMELPDRWAPMYRFRLDVQSPIDFVVANWYTSTHPRSRFTQNLIASRVVGDMRVNLHNKEFSVRQADGRTTDRALAGADDLERVLHDIFDIVPPVPVATIWQKML